MAALGRTIANRSFMTLDHLQHALSEPMCSPHPPAKAHQKPDPFSLVAACLIV
jgi:hypothetical protein